MNQSSILSLNTSFKTNTKQKSQGIRAALASLHKQGHSQEKKFVKISSTSWRNSISNTFYRGDGRGSRSINRSKEKNNIHSFFPAITEIQPKKEEEYFYKILPGNNPTLIKKCMEHRKNWKEFSGTENDGTPHLLWTAISQGIDFMNYSKYAKKYNFTNHLEFHSQISNKLKLFINLMNYCENNGYDLFNYFPFTVLIEFGNFHYLKQLNHFIFFFNNLEDYLVLSKKKKYGDLFYIQESEKIGIKTNCFVPKCFYNGSNLWIIKAVNMNRGRYIELSNSIEDIKNIIKKFYEGNEIKHSEGEEEKNSPKEKVILPKINTQPQKRKFVDHIKRREERIQRMIRNLQTKQNFSKQVITSNKKVKGKHPLSRLILQKYLECPMLYYGRKFDMRIWVLIDHEMNVYMFKEGHLKASSEKYDVSSKDLFVHLTNYSIQKHNTNFSHFEYGNEISFAQFQKSITEEHKLDKTIAKDVIPKISEIIMITTKCARDKINQNERKNCFEIFGYDFIFDKNLVPYLLEINTNPGLEISSPLISKLVPRMIDDALRLTIDKAYPTKYEYGSAEEYATPYPIEGYPNCDNLWVKIGSLAK